MKYRWKEIKKVLGGMKTRLGEMKTGMVGMKDGQGDEKKW